MTANSKREHIPFNRSVYFGQNRCTFIPGCAFENLYHTERMPNGSVVRIYQSDDKRHFRAVHFPIAQALTGNCGILLDKAGMIVWQETNPADRGKGLNKQLRAFAGLVLGISLWSQWQTRECLQAAHLNK